MTAFIALLGGFRAAMFAAIAALLLLVCGMQAVRIDRMHAKAAAEQLREAKATARILTALRKIDSANAATQAANAKRFHDERATIQADADHWRDAWASGRVRVATRFQCPARATGDTGAPGEAGAYGLTQSDAAFLDGFAATRDRIASERNEAVTGWGECRRIGAQ